MSTINTLSDDRYSDSTTSSGVRQMSDVGLSRKNLYPLMIISPIETKFWSMSSWYPRSLSRLTPWHCSPSLPSPPVVIDSPDVPAKPKTSALSASFSGITSGPNDAVAPESMHVGCFATLILCIGRPCSIGLQSARQEVIVVLLESSSFIWSHRHP